LRKYCNCNFVIVILFSLPQNHYRYGISHNKEGTASKSDKLPRRKGRRRARTARYHKG
jgi:hypothetical protein